VVAALVNYMLCIMLIFRHRAQWSTPVELLAYAFVVAVTGAFDLFITKGLLAMGALPVAAKSSATVIGLFLNFIGRKVLVFKEKKKA
jgi:putative flippase GtrA